MSCTKCQKLRDDWLDAMIARDLERLAKTTVEAARHMVAGNEAELPSAPAKPKRKGAKNG